MTRLDSDDAQRVRWNLIAELLPDRDLRGNGQDLGRSTKHIIGQGIAAEDGTNRRSFDITK